MHIFQISIWIKIWITIAPGGLVDNKYLLRLWIVTEKAPGG